MAQASAAVNNFGTVSIRMSGMAAQAANSTGSSFSGLSGKVSSLIQNMTSLRGAIAGVTAVGAVGFGLKMAGDLEMTKVSFEGLLGSAERSRQFIGELQQFTARTPFEFPGVSNAAQQFLALGHSTGQINENLRVIADGLSIAGRVGDENLSRVVRALTQIEGKGKLSAEEINQLAEVMPGAGRARIFEELAKSLDITSQEAQKMAENGLIPAEIGLEAVYEAMRTIPGAAGAADRASQTLIGQLSNLRDAARFAVADAFQPLADILKKEIGPIVGGMGPMVTSVIAPLTTGLASVFTGVFAAFNQLQPQITDLAEIFGDLLTAVGNLIPVSMSMLQAFLVPVIPILRAVAGALEWVTSNSEILMPVMYGLVGAFSALKVTSMVGGIKTMADLLTGVGMAAGAAIGPVTGLGGALKGMMTTAGGIGLAITAISTALSVGIGWWMSNKAATQENKQFVDELTESFDKQTGAITANTNAKIANYLTDKGDKGDKMSAVEAANRLGISTTLVTRAILGQAGAQDELNAAIAAANGPIQAAGQAAAEDADRRGYWTEANNEAARAAFNSAEAVRVLQDKTDGGKESVKEANEQWKENKSALDGVAAATGAVGSAIDKIPPSLRAAELAWKEVNKEAEKMFGVEAAWKEYEANVKEANQRASQAVIDGIKKRADAERAALSKAEQNERDHYDRQVRERTAALDKMLEAEEEAIDEAHEARLEAIDARFEAERKALDDQRELEQDQMDKRHRAEKQALDARIDLLEDAADKRKKILKREHEAQRDEIQWMIDNTFGAEREGWKARLIEIDDQFDDRIDTIDAETEAEKTTWQNSLEDQQDDEQRVFDDRYDNLEEFLDKRETAEKKAATDEYEEAKKAFDARASQQKTALQNEVDAHKTAIDQKYADLKAGVDEAEKKASEAERTRLANANAHYGQSLVDFQNYLNEKTKKADEYNKNMAIIASRGGAEVMGVIGSLPAHIIAQLVNLPLDKFTAALDQIRANIAAGKEPFPGMAGGTGGGGGPGGWFGGVRLGAAGHINRRAMISNSAILWAEAGPEAYIPLSHSRKATSVPILAQTAAALGYGIRPMAGGGVVGWGSAGGSTVDNRVNVDLDVTVNLAAGVDPAIGGYVRREVDRALETVGRELVMRGATR